MKVIETERLVLEEMVAEDAAFMLELLNTASWLKYIGDRNVHTIEEARNYLLYGAMSSYKKSGFGFYRVRLKDSDTIIGTCGLVKRDTLEDADIGFAYLPEYEKKGYAFEAASATLEFAKSRLQLKRIVAITLENNESCIRLLKKLGLQYEHNVRFDENEELMLFGISL